MQQKQEGNLSKTAARLLKFIIFRSVIERQTVITDEAITYIFVTLRSEDSGNKNSMTKMKIMNYF
jgi:hypothetical protein